MEQLDTIPDMEQLDTIPDMEQLVTLLPELVIALALLLTIATALNPVLLLLATTTNTATLSKE